MNTELLNRLETSIEFIKDGLTFKVGDFVLGRTKDGRIFVNGYVQRADINSIDKTSAEKEFREMKDEFDGLVKKSSEFREFALKAGLDYYLLLDTGSAGLNICAEINGEFKMFVK